MKSLDLFVQGTSNLRCFIIFLAILVVIVALLLVRSGRSARTSQNPDQTPFIARLNASFFFWLGMGYLVVLLAIGAYYALNPQLQCGGAPCLIGGVLPIAVPWFGALGAVTISLAGVFFYSHANWDRRFNYWHIGRPFFGAVLGIVAFFIFVLIVTSAGTDIPFLRNDPPAPVEKQSLIIYYVLAFLVGYREETFRELIQRATDLILSRGDKAVLSPQIAFRQGGATLPVLDFGSVAVGVLKPLVVDLENTGKAALTGAEVKIDGPAGTPFTVSAGLGAGVTDIKPGARVQVTIGFTPTAPGPAAAKLVVSGSNLTTAASLEVKGSGQ